MSKVIDISERLRLRQLDEFFYGQSITETAWQTGLQLMADPTITITGGPIACSKTEFDYTSCSIEDALESVEATKAMIRDAYQELNKAADILERVRDAER